MKKPYPNIRISGNFRTHDPWMDICPSVHGSRSFHHAGIPTATFWWTKNPGLLGCFSSHSLCLHKDLCKLARKIIDI